LLLINYLLLQSSFSQDEVSAFRDTFSIIDKDKSGSIDVKELATLMQNLGRDASPERIRDMMKEVDIDGSGEISFEEFLILMEKQSNVTIDDEALRDTFKKFDKDGSGFITREELIEAMKDVDPEATVEDIDNMLKEADADGNNQIDFEEFCAIMR